MEAPRYIPGHPLPARPLDRYLPPIPGGVGPGWLRERAPAGARVLDPFGAAPRLAAEVARAGYLVLVAANNPIARFLLEMAANPPSVGDLRSVLAELAASYKGQERLEPHLRSLYMTECARCNRPVEASTFIWERGGSGPLARVYQCPHCGDAGERPAEEADQQRAAQLDRGGLHLSRALERVAPLADPDRVHAEEALSVYPRRSVYALVTLINKLDSLANLPPGRRRALDALLLAAFDRANTLWPYPGTRSRPRQLTVPPRYREHNVWMALEDAVQAWTEGDIYEAVPLTIWPDLPPEGWGLCLYEGRLRDLSLQAESFQPQAVLAALPRPNQAYWTLSALWAGWLWGPESAAPFKHVLRRRRYDWAWHCTALRAAFKFLYAMSTIDLPFLGLVGETEHGFLSAGLLAGRLAGLELNGLALRVEEHQTQIHWHIPPVAMEGTDEAPDIESSAVNEELAAWMESQAREAGSEYLTERGEPVDFLSLDAAALLAITGGASPGPWPDAPAAVYNRLAQLLAERVFTFRSGFLRFGGSEHSLEIGRWWLVRERGSLLEEPQADRVEVAAVNYLQSHPRLSAGELDGALCSQFTGLFTPDPQLVQLCLESYGEPVEVEGSEQTGWRLRPEDDPRHRRTELATMQALLSKMGRELGYESRQEGDRQVIWEDPDVGNSFDFHLAASALLGRVVDEPAEPGIRPVLVLPGGRAGLLAYKLRCDPRARRIVEDRWLLLKFRQVRRLSGDRTMTKSNIEEKFSQDPLDHQDPQMALL